MQSSDEQREWDLRHGEAEPDEPLVDMEEEFERRMKDG
jgi:hypothetical protein